ncbi:MAG: hypothetical protein JRD89_02890 [Deltaproteobacteria bacterium]|nr:hypothetical protein [Deltaproteobacteria bacterium]
MSVSRPGVKLSSDEAWDIYADKVLDPDWPKAVADAAAEKACRACWQFCKDHYDLHSGAIARKYGISRAEAKADCNNALAAWLGKQGIEVPRREDGEGAVMNQSDIDLIATRIMEWHRGTDHPNEWHDEQGCIGAFVEKWNPAENWPDCIELWHQLLAMGYHVRVDTKADWARATISKLLGSQLQEYIADAELVSAAIAAAALKLAKMLETECQSATGGLDAERG